MALISLISYIIFDPSYQIWKKEFAQVVKNPRLIKCQIQRLFSYVYLQDHKKAGYEVAGNSDHRKNFSIKIMLAAY